MAEHQHILQVKAKNSQKDVHQNQVLNTLDKEYKSKTASHDRSPFPEEHSYPYPWKLATPIKARKRSYVDDLQMVSCKRHQKNTVRL